MSLLHAPNTSITPSPLDTLTETILNVFTKIKTPDVKFNDIKEEINQFESNLVRIEKVHLKSLQHGQEMVGVMEKLGGALGSLGHMESQLTPQLDLFSTELKEYSDLVSTKTKKEEQQYVYSLSETIAYCNAARETLGQRDQKQVDYEELQRFLDDVSRERDKISQGRHVGFSGFLVDKLNDFKGVDPERTRIERVTKLESKMEEVY
jgi:sorting nexin-4